MMLGYVPLLPRRVNAPTGALPRCAPSLPETHRILPSCDSLSTDPFLLNEQDVKRSAALWPMKSGSKTRSAASRLPIKVTPRSQDFHFSFFPQASSFLQLLNMSAAPPNIDKLYQELLLCLRPVPPPWHVPEPRSSSPHPEDQPIAGPDPEVVAREPTPSRPPDCPPSSPPTPPPPAFPVPASATIATSTSSESPAPQAKL